MGVLCWLGLGLEFGLCGVFGVVWVAAGSIVFAFEKFVLGMWVVGCCVCFLCLVADLLPLVV